MTLDQLAIEIREINAANGWNVLRPEEWNDSYKIPAILALIHSEVSEALEAFRKDDRVNFDEEMADVVIRVLDCMGGLTRNFDAVVRSKMEVNRQRAFRHGGKRL
jgi:NTP pyrophosphatase (non-canonical NTP hydrolase)